MMYRPRFIRAIEQCPAASHYLIPCLINAMAGEQWFGVCSMMRLIWSGTRFFELFSLPIVLDGISSWDVSSPVLQVKLKSIVSSHLFFLTNVLYRRKLFVVTATRIPINFIRFFITS